MTIKLFLLAGFAILFFVGCYKPNSFKQISTQNTAKDNSAEIEKQKRINKIKKRAASIDCAKEISSDHDLTISNIIIKSVNTERCCTLNNSLLQHAESGHKMKINDCIIDAVYAHHGIEIINSSIDSVVADHAGYIENSILSGTIDIEHGLTIKNSDALANVWVGHKLKAKKSNFSGIVSVGQSAKLTDSSLLDIKIEHNLWCKKTQFETAECKGGLHILDNSVGKTLTVPSSDYRSLSSHTKQIAGLSKVKIINGGIRNSITPESFSIQETIDETKIQVKQNGDVFVNGELLAGLKPCPEGKRRLVVVTHKSDLKTIQFEEPYGVVLKSTDSKLETINGGQVWELKK